MIEFRTLNKQDEQFVDEMLKTIQDNNDLFEALIIARDNFDTDKIYSIWQEVYARRLLKNYGTHKLNEDKAALDKELEILMSHVKPENETINIISGSISWDGMTKEEAEDLKNMLEKGE